MSEGIHLASARTAQTLLVPDVSRFEDHIVCDGAARSELVIPVFAKGEVAAVLDLDSHELAAFSHREAELLQTFLPKAFADAHF